MSRDREQFGNPILDHHVVVDIDLDDHDCRVDDKLNDRIDIGDDLDCRRFNGGFLGFVRLVGLLGF